jgi:hypothetical protein
VLVERGDDPTDLSSDRTSTVLARPFAANDLSAVLGLPSGDALERAATRPHVLAVTGAAIATTAPVALAGRAALVAQPAGSGEPASLFEPADGRHGDRGAAAPVDVDAAGRALRQPGEELGGSWAVRLGWRRVGPLLTELVRRWRAQRRVRVVGVSALATIGFMVAFALAAQGRCGEGCDDLGTGVAPLPTVSLGSLVAPTTVGRHPPRSTDGTAAVPGSGDFQGASSGVPGPTSSTSARTSTTRPASGAVTPIRPPTTLAPTTTTLAPTTTTLPPTTTTIAPSGP